MRTFTRLTVVSPTVSVDLAVPDDMALAELVRSVVRETGDEATAPWTLHHPVRGLIEPPHTIGSFGVHDGETLLLRADPPPARAIPVDDVARAVADQVPSGLIWAPRAARVLAAGILTAWLVLVPAVATRWVSPFVVTLLGLLGLVVAVVALYPASARRDRTVTATLVPTFALVPPSLAVVTGRAAQWSTSTTVVVALLGAGLGLLIAAALDREVRRPVTAVGVGALTFAVLRGLVLAGGATGLAQPRLDAVAVVALLLLHDSVAWLATRLSGLAALEDRAAGGGEVTLDQVRHRAATARWGMAASALALSSVITLSAVRLALGPDLWAGVLAVATLVVTALRARHQVFVPQVLAQAGPAIVGAGYLMVRLTADPEQGHSWFAALGLRGGSDQAAATALSVLFAGVCAAAVTLSLRGFTPVQLSRTRLVADRLETVLLVASVPLALAVFDVYATVAHRLR